MIILIFIYINSLGFNSADFIYSFLFYYRLRLMFLLNDPIIDREETNVEDLLEDIRIFLEEKIIHLLEGRVEAIIRNSFNII